MLPIRVLTWFFWQLKITQQGCAGCCQVSRCVREFLYRSLYFQLLVLVCLYGCPLYYNFIQPRCITLQKRGSDPLLSSHFKMKTSASMKLETSTQPTTFLPVYLPAVCNKFAIADCEYLGQINNCPVGQIPKYMINEPLQNRRRIARAKGNLKKLKLPLTISQYRRCSTATYVLTDCLLTLEIRPGTFMCNKILLPRPIRKRYGGRASRRPLK